MGSVGARRAGSVLAGLALAGAALLASAPAMAANITINTGQIRGGTTDKKRLTTEKYTISKADCLATGEDAWTIEIPVQVASGFNKPELYAAETDDCAVDTSRNSGNCHLIDIAPLQTGYYKINAKQIVKALNVGNDCVDDSDSSTQRTVKLYFLLTDAPKDTAGTINAENVATYTVKVDLLGPTPPSGTTVDPGDRLLIVTLPGTMSIDPDTYGYYLFCRDGEGVSPTTSSSSGAASSSGASSSSGAGGGGGAGGGASTSSSSGAGGGGAGGAGGATASSSSSSSSGKTTSGSGGAGGGSGGSGGAEQSSCYDTDAIPNTDPKTSPYLCGDLKATSTGVSIFELADKTPLENDHRYVVGVVAYDKVGNVGPLSTLQCATPRSTDTFFGAYCAEGGPGCTSGCSAGPVGDHDDLTWHGMAAGVLAAAGFAARRVRRARSSRQKSSAVEKA
ncbi:MAG: hypothetical protein QM820_05060 [Minicystis sp.]